MSANDLNGEVSLQHKGETFTLRYSIDALCRLEERFDCDVGDLLRRLQGKVRINFLRAVLFEGLQDQHPSLDEKTAGEIIGSYRVIDITIEILTAFSRAFPQPKEGAPADPQTAAVGTGSAI